MEQQRESIRNKVASGLTWSVLERFASQGVSLLVTILLARLLEPSYYGVIAIVTVFITISNVFIVNGLGVSLIQYKDAGEIDFSTVFYVSFAIAVVLYAVMFFAATPIAAFYRMESLVPLVRVMSLRLLVAGVTSIQRAYVSRHMIFKKFFFATLSGTLISGAVSVVMAYRGFGVWALVAYNLANELVNMIVLFCIVPWRPKRMFSAERARKHFRYSWKITLGELFTQLFAQLRTLLIGKLYSAEDLAFYNQGQRVPDYAINNITAAINSVLFPAIANYSDDMATVKAMMRRSIRISAYVLAPLMLGIAACAEALVGVLLTDKWLPCVPYLQITCVVYLFMPIHTANIQAIKAIGRSDMYLKIEIAKRVIGLVILLAVLRRGVLAIAYSAILGDVFTCALNIYPNKKLIGYGYLEQFRDIAPSIGTALVMAACVYAVRLLGLAPLPTLLLQVPVGAGVYIGLSVLLKLDSFRYLLSFLRSFLQKFRGNRHEEPNG